MHTSDYHQDLTLVIDDEIALTATVDVLRAIASGTGPRRCVLALGYAGWAPGQLDAEIQANGWLLVPPDLDLVFGINNDTKWERAIAKIGIDLSCYRARPGTPERLRTAASMPWSSSSSAVAITRRALSRACERCLRELLEPAQEPGVVLPGPYWVRRRPWFGPGQRYDRFTMTKC